MVGLCRRKPRLAYYIISHVSWTWNNFTKIIVRSHYCSGSSVSLLSALIVHIIESNSCNSKNGSKNNVLSCKGCTVVLDCALNKTETKPVWSALNNPAHIDNKRLQVIENYSSKLQVSDLIKSNEDTYCCYAIRRNVSYQYCTWLQIVGE